jgi:hypothetical protein
MMNTELKRELIWGAAWAGGILAIAFGGVLARDQGYIDRETLQRVVIAANGLMIAWYGNRIPKRFVPSASARRAQRVAAWSQVLSGLTFAGLWAFAPIPLATTGGMAVVATGILVTLGYCLTLREKRESA